MSETPTPDQFRPIPETDGKFSVNPHGQIRNNRTRNILKPHVSHRGYHTVTVSSKSRRFTMRVSRVVASAFIPNPENKPQVNHINGIKTDNRAENLEWASGHENQRHAVDVLGLRIGGKSHTARLTEDIVKSARGGNYDGGLIMDLAKSIGVDRITLWKAVTGKTWAHLNAEYPPRNIISNSPYRPRSKEKQK